MKLSNAKKHDTRYNNTSWWVLFMLGVTFLVMLSVYADCRYADCRYAKCLHADCHYAKCHLADCHGTFQW